MDEGAPKTKRSFEGSESYINGIKMEVPKVLISLRKMEEYVAGLSNRAHSEVEKDFVYGKMNSLDRTIKDLENWLGHLRNMGN